MDVQMCIAFSLVVLWTAVDAQVPHWGACPEPSTQPTFNLKQFMGRWFEVVKLPAQFEKGRCIETNFTLTSGGSALVQSSEILKVLPYAPYWILYTDYVSVAVVYSCTDVFRIFHVDFAWILGRSRTLPESTIQHAKEILMENHIDVSRMISSPQEDCDRARKDRAVFQSSL